MSDRTLPDRLVSILDDYAEYELWKKLGGDMFSGAIDQKQAIREILEATVKELHASIMRHELPLSSEPDQAFNYARIHKWIERLTNEI